MSDVLDAADDHAVATMGIVTRENGVMARALPTGTVTFLLTDVAGSTRLWESDPRRMSAAIAGHDEVVGLEVAAHGGILLKAKGEGDSTFSVFASARHA